LLSYYFSFCFFFFLPPSGELCKKLSFRKALWKEKARSGSGHPHWASKPVLEIARRSLPTCSTRRPDTILGQARIGKSGSVGTHFPGGPDASRKESSND
jgi:hypothetical protein